jgi:hypothetical protein
VSECVCVCVQSKYKERRKRPAGDLEAAILKYRNALIQWHEESMRLQEVKDSFLPRRGGGERGGGGGARVGGGNR